MEIMRLEHPRTKNLACSRLHTTARAMPSVWKYLSSVPFVNLDLAKTSCDPLCSMLVGCCCVISVAVVEGIQFHHMTNLSVDMFSFQHQKF